MKTSTMIKLIQTVCLLFALSFIALEYHLTLTSATVFSIQSPLEARPPVAASPLGARPLVQPIERSLASTLMALSGKSDKPKSKILKRVFTVNLSHDGVFVPIPVKYLQGDVKQVTNMDFESMSFEDLTEIVRRLVLGLVKTLYYWKTCKKLGSGRDLPGLSLYGGGFKPHRLVGQKFRNHGYPKKEHYRYDVMDYLNYENVQQEDSESSIDEYYSDDEREIDYADFSINGEDDIMITNLTTQDDFLNRLCSTSGLFRCFVTTPDSSLPTLLEDDLDASTIDP
ncbi:hypothetical protein Tco_0926746 [Tanacetum coccineum]|uniref:Uncharacterized protein n=1 Tax=Tanacetum coccineum TaxID=301880 RepID=A0ABQ5DBG6_9ASTR